MDWENDSLRMLRDSVRAFAAREIAPRAAMIDRDNQFPADRRFASQQGGPVPIGDRTADYPDRLQDYFRFGFFFWFFHLRLFPV